MVRPEVEEFAGKPLGGVLHPLIGVDAPGDPQDVTGSEQKPVLLGSTGRSCQTAVEAFRLGDHHGDLASEC